MRVHGHGFVRAQMLFENAHPLILDFQVRVLRIGD
jgi:hypothetical protein